jgi:hypothetical protein
MRRVPWSEDVTDSDLARIAYRRKSGQTMPVGPVLWSIEILLLIIAFSLYGVSGTTGSMAPCQFLFTAMTP